MVSVAAPVTEESVSSFVLYEISMMLLAVGAMAVRSSVTVLRCALVLPVLCGWLTLLSVPAVCLFAAFIWLIGWAFAVLSDSGRSAFSKMLVFCVSAVESFVWTSVTLTGAISPKEPIMAVRKRLACSS